MPDDDDEEEEHEGHHDAVQEDEALFIQKRIPSSHNVASTHLPPRSHATTASIHQACHNQEESLVTISSLNYIYIVVLFDIIHLSDRQYMI